MILHLNQIDRQPDPVFEGMLDGKLVVSGKGATRSNNAFIDFQGQRYSIASDIHREKQDDKTIGQITDITKNGERIGYIHPGIVPKKKILIFSFGYEYFRYMFEGQEYLIYEAGLGKDQHYFCVYQGEETVAVIKKEDHKVNFRDRYTVYALDDDLLLILSILTLYIDCILYPDHGEATSGNVRSNDVTYTTQEVLRNKYDPEFIPKVLEKENKEEIFYEEI